LLLLLLLLLLLQVLQGMHQELRAGTEMQCQRQTLVGRFSHVSKD
jgi:hypothetical protein